MERPFITLNILPGINSYTLLNGVLWTVALEMQFYLIFPLLRNAFTIKPVITYTVMTIISFAYIWWANGHNNPLDLMHYRYHLSISFLVFAISTAYSVLFYRKIFSNRFVVFFSAISFNLYMWHQFISLELKKHLIPYWSGDTEPNQLNDKPWMWKHLLLSAALSVIAATLTTYFIEKPAAKLILRKNKK